MIKYIVKYTRMVNEQRDGRKKPIWESYTQWSCLYDSLEEATTFAECYCNDCQEVEIFEAPLTLVKQLETQE
jgi:hypothetical protein